MPHLDRAVMDADLAALEDEWDDAVTVGSKAVPCARKDMRRTDWRSSDTEVIENTTDVITVRISALTDDPAEAVPDVQDTVTYRGTTRRVLAVSEAPDRLAVDLYLSGEFGVL